MNNSVLRRIAAAGAVTLLVGFAAASSAQAQNLGGIDVVPTKGDATTLMSIVTERGCTEPAERVSAVIFGKGMPENGQVVVASNEVGLSTTRPMELPISNAFLIYGQNNNTALVGTYTLKVRCTDRIGRPLDEFTTTMKWTTPGGKLANLSKATYTAVSSAGVVAATPSGNQPNASAAPPASSKPQATGGVPPTEESSASAAPQPLANDELPDGSNPDAARVAEPDAAPAASGDETSPLRAALFIGGAALALIAAATLFFRGRRTTSE